MTKAEALLLDFRLIISNARKTIERIPEQKIELKVHEKATTLGNLAMHCATMPIFGVFIIQDDGLDQLSRENRPRPDTTFKSRAECIAQLDEAAAKLRFALEHSDDDRLAAV